MMNKVKNSDDDYKKICKTCPFFNKDNNTCDKYRVGNLDNDIISRPKMVRGVK